MDSQGNPTTPDAPPAPDRTIRIKLEYALATNRLVIKAVAATVMLEGIIEDVLTRGLVDALKVDPEAPMAADGVIRVDVNYDLAKDDLQLFAQAPRVIVKGVLQHALGELSGYQFTQRVQVKMIALEKRVAELEEKAKGPKIHLPGR